METVHWLQMLGVIYLVSGLGMVLGPAPLKGALDELPHNKLATLALAFISLILGAFMVTMHQLWGSVEEIIVSVIGWMALLKGFVYLAFPHSFDGFKSLVNTHHKIRVAGLMCCFIGAGLLAWVLELF